MSRSRTTIRDVANYAGVSHQTVSRVINNSNQVSPQTRQRVEAAIEALGYRPNVIARFMAKGRTGTLVCLSPNLTDYTFASIIEGAQKEAQKYGYFLMSAAAPDSVTFHAFVDQLVSSGRTEGLMVINPYADGRFALIPPRFPVIFAGSRQRQEDPVSSVSLDDVNASYQATQHLLQVGHRTIGMITGPISEDCTQDRILGFQQALQEASLAYDETLIIQGDWSAQSGYNAFKQLISTGKNIDALFVQNDQMAVGCLKAAAEMKISVPEQLSIIGIDDIPIAPFTTPSLTTLHQDFADIGATASRLLIKTIEKSQAEEVHVQLSARLIVRDSTA